LKTLKDRSASAAVWERIVKQKCDLGKSRAYELLKIADGRTTLEKTRAADAAKHKRLRSSSPGRPGKSRALAVPEPAPGEPLYPTDLLRSNPELTNTQIAEATGETRREVSKLRREMTGSTTTTPPASPEPLTAARPFTKVGGAVGKIDTERLAGWLVATDRNAAELLVQVVGDMFLRDAFIEAANRELAGGYRKVEKVDEAEAADAEASADRGTDTGANTGVVSAAAAFDAIVGPMPEILRRH
jgi:hypothetical protein